MPRQTRIANDPALYDRLAGEWWRPRGVFAVLHWLAAARGALVPAPERPGAVLVDLGCGAGLLAPHVEGYVHVGVDVSRESLALARKHGVMAVRADVAAVPLPDECADVVVAGEILEHVPDLAAVVAEACRLLRPGGLLVVDTLAATALCRFLAIGVAERIPRIATRGVHDPALLVDRRELVRECRRHGVALTLRGIMPHLGDAALWLARRREAVRMAPVPTTAVLFQAWGVKGARPEAGPGR
ncbi:methyltransferase domain-containing protein [Glycomyces artemisiae]|uniref:2-polyprenyl-6-hydroxyphenyl methylase/3-demethylubiquinone-9 3-methyltransferase n=1 Tax=Glycomyces artemisiae TaxID=1076443 RepID=A0A2T0UFN6_9ACTN|nr:methyltransferase domain-containing protein [Glycomyces artemisiae]PRY56765.1 2-polyprenyl-6-hydroxyphenyl methylase/3-demethylubiquinone-9 3-methyltransferase [Glycomyces artemisiae]